MSDPAVDSDVELIHRCARGDEAALRALFQRYHGVVYNLLHRMLGHRDDADELLPEVFLKLWHGAHGFQSRANPVTWIYRIAANACIDRLRRRPPLAGIPLDELGENAAAVPYDPDRRLIMAEQCARLQSGLMALAPEDRLLITLYHLQERSYDEVAQITGLSYVRLKSRLFRARQRLRQRCGEEEREATDDDLSEDSTAVARFQLRPA